MLPAASPSPHTRPSIRRYVSSLVMGQPAFSMSPTTDLKQVQSLGITFLVDNSIEWLDRHPSISSFEPQPLTFQDD
jgi:hypothetical protein